MILTKNKKNASLILQLTYSSFKNEIYIKTNKYTHKVTCKLLSY